MEYVVGYLNEVKSLYEYINTEDKKTTFEIRDQDQPIPLEN